MTYEQPIYYATAACETMMRKFKAENLPPKGHFHYHQGVFLSGVHKTYLICNDKRYIQYIRDWVDSVIDENGNRKFFHPRSLDDIQPGILLFPLLDLTGDEKYKKALDLLMDAMDGYPRNEVGGFWHQELCPEQMWLDGLYMGGPIYAEYGKRFQKPEYLETVIEQALLMQKHTIDKETGLLYHAWDCAKKQPWADPYTGLSEEFWGRSIGWVPVGVLDDLDFIDPEQKGYDELCDMVRNLLIAVCRYQSECGLWYQVVNKGGMDGNWLETSCGCLFTAAICKAVRKGILDESYLQNAKKCFNATIDKLEWENENVLIGNVCIGTGVGDYKHYCDRPTSTNDLHGVGAFLLMCAEAQQVI